MARVPQSELFEGTDAGSGGGSAAGAGDSGSQADKGKGADLIPRSEAEQAFRARDEAKRKLREAQDAGLILTPEQKAEIEALREAQAKLDEERKRKAGEFDQWRAEIARKHEEAVTAERTRAQQVTQRLHDTLKDHEFAAAREWFGGSDAKTILTPAIAAAYFGKYVHVETTDDGRDRVVVKNLDGHTILNAKTGQPAAFAEAMGELIGMLPDRDSILRGSGKTGSGSSGGSTHGAVSGVVDTRNLKPADFRDPKVREAVKRQHAVAGGLQIGPAFDRVDRSGR